MPRVFHGAAGLALDLLMYTGIVIVMLGLFGSTRDRVEKTGIVACFANLIIKPHQMFFPSYAALQSGGSISDSCWHSFSHRSPYS